MNIRNPDDAARQGIRLRNDGSLSLTFIGAGSAFTKKYFQNNLLVVKGDDHVLIDCGSRAPEALSRLGLSVMDVRNYLITHSHADHIGGLEEVMLMNRYAAKRKATIVAPEAYMRRLWNDSLKGGAAYNERVNGRYLRFEDFWDAVPLRAVPGADRELCEGRVGSIKVAMFRTMHIPDSAPSWKSSAPSYGVVIDDRIFYSSDSRFDPELVASMDARYRFEALFHDCQLFTGGVHASLDELAGLPAAVKSRMRLMHYGDAAPDSAGKAADMGFAGFVEQWKPYGFGTR